MYGLFPKLSVQLSRQDELRVKMGIEAVVFYLETKHLREKEEAVEAALRNVPVGFVRQWINEDLLRDGHELVTNEQIQQFINIALTPTKTDKQYPDVPCAHGVNVNED